MIYNNIKLIFTEQFIMMGLGIDYCPFGNLRATKIPDMLLIDFE